MKAKSDARKKMFDTLKACHGKVLPVGGLVRESQRRCYVHMSEGERADIREKQLWIVRDVLFERGSRVTRG